MSKHQIQINLPGLLRMLGENIYSDPEVAVREMIQNAHDGTIIRTTKDAGFHQPRIDLAFDKTARTLTITDNGTGMTDPELHKNLATIGESFTRIQKQELRGQAREEAALLIGQFGIGLLSAFAIARRVEFFTRSYQAGSTGLQWACEGDIHYSVEPAPKEDIGTRVVLHLLDSKLDLLDEKRLRQAIKKYADFLSVPIHLNGQQVNTCPRLGSSPTTPSLTTRNTSSSVTTSSRSASSRSTPAKCRRTPRTARSSPTSPGSCSFP